MSKLYLSESGRVVPTLCEELTASRRARKLLHLPPTAGPGVLYLLARPHKGNERPLCLCVNGIEPPPISPQPTPAYLWYEVPLEPALLKPGVNVCEFWTDATAMNAWALALEAGHRDPESRVSDDGGATWRDERMGYLNVLRGEYVARIRLPEGGILPRRRSPGKISATRALSGCARSCPRQPAGPARYWRGCAR